MWKVIETREAFEAFIANLRRHDIPWTHDLVLSFEALRRVARAGKNLPLEYDEDVNEWMVLDVDDEPHKLLEALAHIEQHAPWFLEEDPDEG